MKKKFLLLMALILSWGASGQIIITKIESKSGGRCPNSNPQWCYSAYKVNYIRVPGPLDNEIINKDFRNVVRVGIYSDHTQSSTGETSCGKFVTHDLYPKNLQIGCTLYQYYGEKLTWRDVEQDFVSKYGATGPVVINYNGYDAAPRDLCLRFGASDKTWGVPRYNGNLPCIVVPPTPDPGCTISENPVIDFGNVSIGDTNGRRAGTTANMNCNLDASVKIYNPISNVSKVILGGWGEAEITVNGNYLPTNVAATKGNTPLLFEAKINGNAIIAGEYVSSMIITIGYQ